MTEENLIHKEIIVKSSKEFIKTPGTLLREARQAKNLNLSDIAKQMRLSVQWVKDLEKDNYSHAPAVIYIRGYLRAFARCVGVSQDEVMAAFDAMGLEEEFERIKAREERPVKHHAVPVISKSTRMISRKTLRWVTVAVLLILVVLVGVWWQGKKYIVGQLHTAAGVPQENVPLSQPVVPEKNIHHKNSVVNNKITFSGTDH